MPSSCRIYERLRLFCSVVFQFSKAFLSTVAKREKKLLPSNRKIVSSTYLCLLSCISNAKSSAVLKDMVWVSYHSEYCNLQSEAMWCSVFLLVTFSVRFKFSFPTWRNKYITNAIALFIYLKLYLTVSNLKNDYCACFISSSWPRMDVISDLLNKTSSPLTGNKQVKGLFCFTLMWSQ